MNFSKTLLPITLISFLAAPVFADEDEDESPWYIRADIGASFADDQNIHYGVDGTYPSPDPNNPDFDFGYRYNYDVEFEDAFVGQLGVGYIFSEWLRSDLTIAQDFERDISGTCNSFTGTHDDDIGPNCVAEASDEVIHAVGDLNSSLMTSRLMLNGYFEFAPLWTDMDEEIAIIRPYVGFGIGLGRNELDDATIHKDFRDEGQNVAIVEGDTHYDFAWQAIAGIGFMLTDELILDVAYTYVDTGTAEYEDNIEILGHEYPIDGLSYDVDLQEVTIGLRYLFS